VKLIAASFALSVLLAGVAVPQHGFAQTPTPQQERMKSCNAQAGEQKLAGDARKSFMSGCLSGKPAAAAPQTPQERMKSCNAQATTQKVTGDQRKTFMSTCLRG
jgi:hypothetical protein